MHKDSINKDILALLEEKRFDSYSGGNGWGDGYSNDWGGGYGIFYGNGNGWSYGNGNGSGDGYGDGWGNGWGDSSNGYGGGDGGGDVGLGIVEINGMKVYNIDRMLTAVETVFGTYAKGYTISNGAVLTPCYVAMDGFSLAHGDTLKDAFRDAMSKEMAKLPEEERVKRFATEHPDPSEILPNEELFYIHHTLTGSCKFGREEFCRKNSIDFESSMSISEFLSLTENEYGGEVIRKIREEYLHQAKSGVPEISIFAS